MPTINFDISMSLDGYITAAHRTPEEPMGKGGLQLHDWGFSGADPQARQRMEQDVTHTGAIICGRRTYDDSLPWWHADGPVPTLRTPVIVVTHNPPATSPENSVYTFVPDLDIALARARSIAGDKNISVMGANTIQQFLRAGLFDEFQIHIVPVLFHDGIRLFEHLDIPHTQLEPIAVHTSPVATHITYRVLK
jgi:dihydrofolate reductase